MPHVIDIGRHSSRSSGESRIILSNSKGGPQRPPIFHLQRARRSGGQCEPAILHNGNVPPLTFPEARETVLQSVRSSPNPAPGRNRPPACCHGPRTGGTAGRRSRLRPRFPAPSATGSRCAPSTFPDSSRSSAKCAPATFSTGEVGRGEAVEIMTGAPIPAGADAVVMVEHTRREGALRCHRSIRRARPIH